MRRALAFVVGAVLVFLALAATAPASLVDGRLDTLSAGKVRLTSATGTLWNGAGEIRVLAGNTGMPVAWHIDAWPLLRGELRGTFSGSDDATPASFTLSSRETAVRNVAIAMPASVLQRVAVVPTSLATMGGSVGLRISELIRQGDRIDGQLALHWDQATLQPTTIGPRPMRPIALGDVRFDGTGQASAIAGPLTNAGGDVEISGTASISENGAMRIDALIRPRAGIDAERTSAIGAALGAIGQPDGSGAFRVAWAQ